MTYTEACDSLITMLENAMFDYEYECLSEAAGDEEGKSSKIKTAIKAIGTTIAKMFRAIAKIMKACYDKAKSAFQMMIANKHLVANKDMKILKCAKDSSILTEYFNKIQSAYKPGSNIDEKDMEKILSELVKIGSDYVEYHTGDDLGVGADYLKSIKRVEVLSEKCAVGILKRVDMIDNFYNEPHESITLTAYKTTFTACLQRLMTIANEVNTNIHQIIANSDTGKKESKNGETKYTANGKSANKAMGKYVANHDTTYVESVGDDSISALRARCLIEAASILKEAADDAYVKVDPAQQKDVEGIPEEKPVEAPEYPEETSGGEGIPEDFLEDIKDLVDDDKKAMDLLIDDEDKSLTIEESVNLLLDL